MADTPIITIESGQIEGRYVTDKRDKIAVFKGIPYAAPPVGDLRWRPPQPVAPWSGVCRAKNYGPTAYTRMKEFNVFIDGIVDGQGFGAWKSRFLKTLLRYAPKPPQSEDCLTLNVRTPALNGKLPVMVWIHGGAHQAGSSRDVFYESNTLAQQGVVLVTLNYRLGIFGFFAHPELSAESEHGVSGNYGMLDQIFALEWVQRNIAAFGGDPDNVTIFGESAGGESVMHMMASPLARGLFHKAIAQSPATGVQRIHLKRPFHIFPSYEDVGVGFANDIGLDGDNQIEQLRNMSGSKLMSYVLEREREYGGYYPVIDGYVLPKTVFQTFAAGEQADVPLIIGSNANETTLFYPLFPVPIPEYYAWFEHPNGRLPDYMEDEFGDDLARLKQIYPGLEADEEDAVKAHQGDLMFGAPVRFYAGEAAKRGQSVYVYMFRRAVDSETQTAGAFHASELPFVFDTSSPMFPFNKEDYNLAETMREYWTSFAKTAVPHSKTADWESFDNDDPRWMLFDRGAVGMRPVSREAQYQIFIKRIRRILNEARQLVAAD